jgi:hypothetical protein
MPAVISAFKDEVGRFTGKAPMPRVPPGDFKVCSRCRDEKAIDQFTADKKASDGRHCWCKQCRTDDMRERRAAKKAARNPEDVASGLLRLGAPMLIAKLKALLAAARAARTAGTWRGREAIRAYRNLGLAIEALHVETPETEDAMERDVPDCTCRTTDVVGCARHADVAAAYLAIYRRQS